MSSAKITLLGVSRWMKDNSDDLFKAFDDLPVGIDKDVLVNNILLRGGEFEVIYADPYFMQESIYTWLAKWRRTLEKWLAALAVEYDPLYNYDRHEEYTDTEGIGDTETRSGTRIDGRSRVSSENMTGSTDGSTSGSQSNTSSAATNTTGTDTGSQGTENKVSAFDASTYQAKDRSDTTTGSSTSSSTGTTGTNSAASLETRSENMSKSASESGSESGSESTADTRAASRNRLLQHTAHLFGNIGVVSSQEMLQAELSIAEWNLYDHITDLFLTEYIIPVYV